MRATCCVASLSPSQYGNSSVEPALSCDTLGSQLSACRLLEERWTDVIVCGALEVAHVRDVLGEPDGHFLQRLCQ